MAKEFNRAHFGSLIKEYRKKGKYTQKEFADLLGVSQNAISNWELEKREPENIDTLINISYILDIPMSALSNPDDYTSYKESIDQFNHINNDISTKEDFYKYLEHLKNKNNMDNVSKELFAQQAAEKLGILEEYHSLGNLFSSDIKLLTEKESEQYISKESNIEVDDDTETLLSLINVMTKDEIKKVIEFAEFIKSK